MKQRQTKNLPKQNQIEIQEWAQQLINKFCHHFDCIGIKLNKRILLARNIHDTKNVKKDLKHENN